MSNRSPMFQKGYNDYINRANRDYEIPDNDSDFLEWKSGWNVAEAEDLQAEEETFPEDYEDEDYVPTEMQEWDESDYKY